MTHTATVELDPATLRELIAIRHRLHQHPEIAFTETATADLVAAELQRLDIEVHRGLAKTGVVGTLRGRRGTGRRIGLRADMDALCIDETNTFAHRSQVAGKMHACGHDGHTTMLLGAARLLARDRDFAGEVRFIFQPAEESEGGARVMIEEGLFDRFPCDAVYAMHNAPGLEVGQFATREGPVLAAGDTWEVTFSGSGGHGAMPHLATDPTMAAGAFISGVSTVVARNVPSADNAVISIGHVNGGQYRSPNIIPSTVLVRGTARSFRPEVRQSLEDRLRDIAHSAAAMHGCRAEYRFIRRYPSLVNHPKETAIAVAAARRIAGHASVNGDTGPLNGSEDFAFMLNRVPGAYMFIGNGASSAGLHTPQFDFNDDALAYGVAYFVSVVREELGS